MVRTFRQHESARLECMEVSAIFLAITTRLTDGDLKLVLAWSVTNYKHLIIHHSKHTTWHPPKLRVGPPPPPTPPYTIGRRVTYVSVQVVAVFCAMKFLIICFKRRIV